MVKYTSIDDFLSLSAYEFEEAVAMVWKNHGWKTEVTTGSNDYGIDIIARKGRGPKFTAIQAKRFDPDTKIGGPQVRRYATLYQQNININNVIIVTTSSFTAQAKELGSSLEVSLVDGKELVGRSTQARKRGKRMSSEIAEKSRKRMRKKLHSDPHRALDEVIEKNKSGTISKRKFKILKRILVDEIRNQK
jgi:hypothetical protein